MEAIALGEAFWLGILTSVSPCPLATNIAAISFVGRRVSSPQQVLFSGVVYTLGRSLVYVVIGALLVAGLLSIPGVSTFLQKYMNKILGPLLIVVGMFLLDLIQWKLPVSVRTERLQERMGRAGIWGAGLLGVIFALSFCPVSAALFFGRLIPLSLEHGSSLALPSLYGVGTGLPVLVFALVIAFGTQSVGGAFTRVSQIEWWARRITGAIFILVGIRFTLVYIFRISLPGSL